MTPLSFYRSPSGIFNEQSLTYLNNKLQFNFKMVVKTLLIRSITQSFSTMGGFSVEWEFFGRMIFSPDFFSIVTG